MNTEKLKKEADSNKCLADKIANFHFSQLTVEMNDLSHFGVIKTSVYLL